MLKQRKHRIMLHIVVRLSGFNRMQHDLHFSEES